MLAAIVFFGVPTRRRWATLAIALVLLASIGGIGCGGGSKSSSPPPGSGSNGGTTAGTYTVTMTGVDAATGKLTSTTAVTVTVN
jgi:hypothetical protein